MAKQRGQVAADLVGAKVEGGTRKDGDDEYRVLGVGLRKSQWAYLTELAGEHGISRNSIFRQLVDRLESGDIELELEEVTVTRLK